MHSKKVIKNIGKPKGRVDWDKRSPRVRTSITNAQLMIIKEWADNYFNDYPEKKAVLDYSDLYERILSYIEFMEKPLTKSVDLYPLLDE